MSEIYLNEVQIAMVKKAIADGKKCLIISDLMINIFGAEIEVTNAHTGDVMNVVNYPPTQSDGMGFKPKNECT